jgi:riboflavin biosynthesis pyrimidine reductase
MSDDASLHPLELLYEDVALPRASLPEGLARLYDGDLGIAEECVYANFVASLDGAVAIPSLPGSNGFIAGDSDADRFVMGLLRAFADVVLVGSGVLRASPRGTWQPGPICPHAADDYAEVRRNLGLTLGPEVAVLTGSGEIDAAHPVFETGALVLTSASGSERLVGRLPSASDVVSLGESPTIDPTRVVDALRGRGLRRVLCEAGPHTFGNLLRANVVDELFLTSSPLLVGDAGTGSRLRLVEAADLVPAEVRPHLLSLRRDGSYLFARYALR